MNSWNPKSWRFGLPSLKLTASLPLKIGPNAPKGKDRLPTIHFQGRTVSFREGRWFSFSIGLHSTTVSISHISECQSFNFALTTEMLRSNFISWLLGDWPRGHSENYSFQSLWMLGQNAQEGWTRMAFGLFWPAHGKACVKLTGQLTGLCRSFLLVFSVKILSANPVRLETVRSGSKSLVKFGKKHAKTIREDFPGTDFFFWGGGSGKVGR